MLEILTERAFKKKKKKNYYTFVLFFDRERKTYYFCCILFLTWGIWLVKFWLLYLGSWACLACYRYQYSAFLIEQSSRLASRASRASRASQTFSIAFWKCLRPILALQIGTTSYKYLCNRFQALRKVLLRFFCCILTTKQECLVVFFKLKFSDCYSSDICSEICKQRYDPIKPPSCFSFSTKKG